MAETTKIQWCDHSASPWYGCTHGVYLDADGNEHEHPGCLNCYAEAGAKRNPKTLGEWGPNGTRARSVSFIRNLKKWQKAAEAEGRIVSVFPSLCDPFEDWSGPILDAKGERYVVYKPNGGTLTVAAYAEEPPANCRWLTMADLRREMFATIDQCPNVRLLLLTKRPGNVRQMWDYSRKLKNHTRQNDGDGIDAFRENIWLLTSVSDQATADALIPPLLACRDLVPVLGVSAEPLLGPVNLEVPWEGEPTLPTIQVDWVIIGGESGPHARPCDFDWGRSIVQQCHAANVPVFYKQVGSKPIYGTDRLDARRYCSTIWGPIKDPKGGNIDEWPLDLCVREFPEVRT